jgi:hypothetical protein
MLNDVIKATFLSRLAYKRNSRVSEELRASDYHFVLIDDIEVANPNNFVQRTDPTLRVLVIDDVTEGERYFVFRGSANISNWITNFKFRKTQWKSGKVHTGFLLAGLELCKRLECYKDFSKLMIATGHSLGGALAQVCKEEIGTDKCIVIGSPKLGDADYVSGLEQSDYERIEHDLDPVPFMPPYIFGYRHSGTNYYIDRNKNVIIDPSETYILTDTAIAIAKRRKEGLGRIAYDHHFDLYLEHLKINHRKAKVRELDV